VTFQEVLAQVIAWLQQDQRISYRALQRQFALDKDYLEDLRDELISAKQCAVDEDGKVLVWIGTTGPTTALTSPSTQQAPLAAGHADPSPVAPPPTASHAPEAERRQLTVLFCDLVDSMTLASQLDPEDYRDVVQAYQATCAQVIRRFDGYIAQYLGDGVLVYFGYPQAHEDDAERAVRTGLGIVEAMGALPPRLQSDPRSRLAVRLGIHTGLVVIGEIGEGTRQEPLALGETPNIAARLQGLAAPDTVVISEATARLVAGVFTWCALAAEDRKGLPQPLRVYRVLHAHGTQTRLDVAATRGRSPLVGREAEVTVLLDRWAQVQAGRGQGIVLSGEAGIGKSRLVQVLKEHVASVPHTRWECHGSPYYQHTALYPLIECLPRALQWHPEATPEEKGEKLAQIVRHARLPVEESVPLLASLLALSLPEGQYPPLALSPQRQRQKTLETIVTLLVELAARQPVLFILEDVHWTDPTTQEWLALLLDHTATAAICTVLTTRPVFHLPWRPRSSLTQVTLSPLSPLQVAQLAEQVAGGKRLPAEVLQQVIARTDGIPLFVEELTKALLESGILQGTEDRYALTGPLPAFAIPSTLQDALMARLDRLVTAKGVAQLGATIGRHFSYTLLRAVAPVEEDILSTELRRLVEAEILAQHGVLPQATYTFTHALIQETAYQSLLKSTRQQYHRRIAQVLEAHVPDLRDTQPELLAHHYTEAGFIAQALPYWQQAGQRALERSANVEAIAHLTKGVELLKSLPDTPASLQQELALQIALGVPLAATRGAGALEVERTYTRARELCQQVGETPQLFPVLYGLWLFYLVRAQLATAQKLGEELLNLAQRTQDATLLIEAHRALGTSLFYLGALARGRAHLEQAITFYDPQQHRSLAFRIGPDPRVVCGGFAAWALGVLGYPDQALQRSYDTHALAQELAHPFTLAYTLDFVARIHQLRREGQPTRQWAEALLMLSREQGFTQRVATGTILLGWALTTQGQQAEGVGQVRQGLAAFRATGAELARPYYLALLAEVYVEVGEREDGLSLLAEALATVHKTGEGLWEAELHRLKGELLLALLAEKHAEAETCFHHALDIARRQQAKSLELRAAMSLSRLWQQQGKRAAAYELLLPIYGWFTEGFGTADLQEAKALLEELG
jgi:predicted ATPase/class 3 adenylate cyclase